MNKQLLFSLSACLFLSSSMMAQSAMDGFQFSQPDLKGTARFMSMGGAFGALGADMTVLNQNPGGIGVYRSSEIGFTVDLDAQSSTANSQNQDYTTDQTKFYLNNIGFISTIKFDNSALKNFNIGFTYNKTSSFNRRYSGGVANLSNSMSNYIAGVANNNGLTEADVTTTNTYDPYNPNDGGYESPWITILGYDSYLISPDKVNDNTTNWYGQWTSGTSGSGNFSVEERGSMSEYNIALGGNFNNFLYWGMDFGIVDLQYDQYTSWGENLKNAYVDNTIADNRWSLGNSYSVSGTGFNYKLGFIVKPIQELRIGVAVHTPTWYNLKESFIGSVDYMYPKNNYAITNNGYTGEYEYDFRTPWRFILSAAGVIEGRMIVSADYEFTDYQYMHFTDKYTSDYWDWSSNQYTDAYYYTNQDVKDYYQQQHTFRFGLEYRLTRNFSARAGYCFVSSPVKQAVKDNKADIYTAGTRLSYAFDNNTNYVTCGLGYKNKGFALDLAYVYKTRESIFHAYPSDMDDLTYVAPSAKITSNNHQVVMSMSFKF